TSAAASSESLWWSVMPYVAIPIDSFASAGGGGVVGGGFWVTGSCAEAGAATASMKMARLSGTRRRRIGADLYQRRPTAHATTDRGRCLRPRAGAAWRAPGPRTAPP